MLKKGLLLAILVMFTLGAAAKKSYVVLDKVVAVVGMSSILYSEVEAYAKELVEQRRSQGYTSDRDPMNEALEALLTQKLLYNQALIDSVAINSVDIASRVDQQINYLVEEEGSIQNLEAKQHMAIFNIREMMRQQAEEQSYANAMQSEVVNKILITPGEVERFYKKTDKDSLPIIPKQYVYAQITQFPTSITAAKQRTKEELLDLRARIVQGDSKFANLARAYSVDGSALYGGEMDPRPLQGFVQTFADALGALKIGQVSEVVETEHGFHLIELLEKRGDQYRCRHILLRPRYTNSELLKPTQILDSLVRLIRSDSLTFEQAAREHSDDKSSKMNGGVVSNHDMLMARQAFDAKLTVTKFFKEDFGDYGQKGISDYNAISLLDIGEVSNAYMTEDMLGNKLSNVVKLLEIIPSHKASLVDDYIRLEEMALYAKQESEFSKWLSHKIDAMYIFIAPEFRDGQFEIKRWVK